MSRSTKGREVITLADLAPRRDVVGGSARRVFGADPMPTSSAFHRATNPEDTMGKKGSKKDLSPKKETKGGRRLD